MCLVAVDDPDVLDAVAAALGANGIEVVCLARDGREAVQGIEALRPDVALLGLRLPALSGIEVARRVCRSTPDTAVILDAAFAERALLVDALDVGARGFVLREAPLAEAVRAVELVASGRTYVDPVLAAVLSSPAATEKLSTLTRRERDVLRLLADGMSSEEVGSELGVAPATVRAHVRRAMATLAADTRTEAVATALRQFLLG